MTVAELIEFLKTQPQDLPVAYQYCSDYSLLEAKDIYIEKLSLPRNDGYIAAGRPDRGKQEYLVFPGN